jgi:hypothetical protein
MWLCLIIHQYRLICFILKVIAWISEVVVLCPFDTTSSQMDLFEVEINFANKSMSLKMGNNHNFQACKVL